MIKFKESSTGNSYINFQYGRVFITESEKCVTLKAHKTWQGNHYQACHWVCLSIKSQKPIIYRFVPAHGIQNITYQTTLLKEIDCLLDRVSSRKDKDKRNRIKLKFLALCNQLFAKRCDFQTLNADILRVWMPLLNHYKDEDVLKFIPVFRHPLVRQGFKQAYLKDCISLWFGHSPKGLTRRIANILEQKNFSQLLLALSCRSWNLDHLYSLLDLNIAWYIDIDLKKASSLLNAYSEKRWLKLLETFSYSHRHDLYDAIAHQHYLYDAIQLFDEIRNSDYSLPENPISVDSLYRNLLAEYETQTSTHYLDSPGLNNAEIGEFVIFCVDDNHHFAACLNCTNFHGKSYNGNPLVCAIHPYGQENCPDFEQTKM